MEPQSLFSSLRNRIPMPCLENALRTFPQGNEVALRAMKSGIRVQKIAEKPETEKQKMSPKQNRLGKRKKSSILMCTQLSGLN